jgi:hypothetical protein
MWSFGMWDVAEEPAVFVFRVEETRNVESTVPPPKIGAYVKNYTASHSRTL